MKITQIKCKLRLSAFFAFLACFSAGFVLADDASMSVFAVALSAPENLAATVISYSQINLSWSAVVGAESYNVYKSGVLAASVDTNSYSATGLSSETTYSFTVSAVDSSANESSQSLAVSATTLKQTAIIPPGGGGREGVYFNLIVPAQKGFLAVPEGGFKILINGGEQKTNKPLVNLLLEGGVDATKAKLSNNPDFEGAIVERYAKTKTWVLQNGDGEKKVYVRFLDDQGNFSPAISAGIILDTAPPNIIVNETKESYESGEEIILSGNAGEQAEIIFYWDKKYGLIEASTDGSWTANLGQMAAGSHSIFLITKDSAGNFKTIVLDIFVKAPAEKAEEPAKEQISSPFSFLPFVFENIEEKIKSAARFISEKQETPARIILISRDAPAVLSKGWNLLPMAPLKEENGL